MNVEAEIAEVKRVSGHLRCSNIYHDMPKNHRSVNVGRERQATAHKKMVCSVSTKNQDVKVIFKVV